MVCSAISPAASPFPWRPAIEVLSAISKGRPRRLRARENLLSWSSCSFFPWHGPHHSRRFTWGSRSSESPVPLEANLEPHCHRGGLRAHRFDRLAWRFEVSYRLSP